MGTFISLLPFPEIKGQRTGVPGGLSEAGAFPVLWAARGATGCQRRGEENIEPEGGVGAEPCSLESSLRCQARKPPRGQCKGHPVPSSAGAAENSAQEDPRREVRGHTGTGGQLGAERGIVKLPEGPMQKGGICFLSITRLPPEKANFSFRFIYNHEEMGC